MTADDRQQELKSRALELAARENISFARAWTRCADADRGLYAESSVWDVPTPMLDWVQTLPEELRDKLAKPPPVYRFVDDENLRAKGFKVQAKKQTADLKLGAVLVHGVEKQV